MNYLGGKFRLKKPISEIINRHYKPNRTFVSLFCGACNVESLVNFDNIILNDKHECLIAMWQDFFNGRKFKNEISREEYYYIKEHCKDDKGLYGLIGFGSSFGGKFWGGYAYNNCGQNYLDDAIRGNIKIANNLKRHNTILLNKDYKDVEVPANSVVYCDPPYCNTTKYSKDMSIDYEEFWDYMRELSVNNIVFISEEQAPEDFIPIFEKEQRRMVDRNKDNKKTSIEKLVVHKSQINNIKEV